MKIFIDSIEYYFISMNNYFLIVSYDLFGTPTFAFCACIFSRVGGGPCRVRSISKNEKGNEGKKERNKPKKTQINTIPRYYKSDGKIK